MAFKKRKTTIDMKHVAKLFNTSMVKAILDGSKNQTRRTKGLKIINLNPDNYSVFFEGEGIVFKSRDNSLSVLCRPEAKPGDIFWVRESTCYVMRDHAHYLLEGAKTNNQFVYRSSVHSDWMDCAKEKYGYKWKPSIFMPKEACRIFLEVTDVRVERLHDISEDDAIAEGIEVIGSNFDDAILYKDYMRKGIGTGLVNAPSSFFSLWESINGKESLDSNPWVFVYSFERVEKPLNFNK
jgi:hypothetical protein